MIGTIYWFLYMICFVVLLITQIVYLVKSVKTKYNKNWCILFTIISSSILSIILLWILYFINVNEIESLPFTDAIAIVASLLSSFIAIIIYALMLLISAILKVLEVRKNKKQNIKRKKLSKSTLRKAIALPFLIVVLISFGLYVTEHFAYIIQDKIETQRYSKTNRHYSDF